MPLVMVKKWWPQWKRRERRRGGAEAGKGRGSPSFVKEKSLCGMNTFVYSFASSIFSPVGLWLLERRCRLAPSQKESIFLRLLHFSLFFSNSIFFSKTPLCPLCPSEECWQASGRKPSGRDWQQWSRKNLWLRSPLSELRYPSICLAYWCIFIFPCSQLLRDSWDPLWPIYNADAG